MQSLIRCTSLFHSDLIEKWIYPPRFYMMAWWGRNSGRNGWVIGEWEMQPSVLQANFCASKLNKHFSNILKQTKEGYSKHYASELKPNGKHSWPRQLPSCSIELSLTKCPSTNITNVTVTWMKMPIHLGFSEYSMHVRGDMQCVWHWCMKHAAFQQSSRLGQRLK